MEKISYLCGLTNEPLVSWTISDILELNVIECPDKVACISQHQAIRKTYKEMGEDVSNVISFASF